MYMRLSNLCQTSRLLNMLWVPPQCAHPERGSGVLLWQLFVVDEGREDPNTT